MLKSKFSFSAVAAVVAVAFVSSCQKTDLSQIETDINTAKINISNLQDMLDMLDAKIDYVYLELADTSSIQTLRERIDSLQKRIDGASNRLDALSSNFEKTRGEVMEELDSISDDIDELRSDIESRLDALDAFADSVRTFEDSARAFADSVRTFADSVRRMVQSAVFVPRHTGGCAVVRTSADLQNFTLDYEIFPEECAAAIADSYIPVSDILSVCYRDVSVRSGLPVIPITGVSVNPENQLLEVTVKLDGAPGFALSSGDAIAVSLKINTGITTVSSPFTDIIMPQFVDLSAAGTANCYIVSGAGDYKFKATVKGNGNTPEGTRAAEISPASAVVLWESFGKSQPIAAGALVNGVVLDGDYVLFTATSLKGNAVIAVKDSGGEILWSWHIWLTDAPEKQVYANDAGTMMDRNLGATSAVRGDIGALGLLYQWGRKDPFLGSGKISNIVEAGSIMADGLAWGNVKGLKTLEYAVKNPTTFITDASGWSPQNDNLWKSASDAAKTIYDPCPVGWRVPYGGADGVWAVAMDAPSTPLLLPICWDSVNKGVDLGLPGDYRLGSGIIWYPAAGSRSPVSYSLTELGNNGFCWSCDTPSDDHGQAYGFGFTSSDDVALPSFSYNRANGYSVRCIAE